MNRRHAIILCLFLALLAPAMRLAGFVMFGQPTEAETRAFNQAAFYTGSAERERAIARRYEAFSRITPEMMSNYRSVLADYTDSVDKSNAHHTQAAALLAHRETLRLYLTCPALAAAAGALALVLILFLTTQNKSIPGENFAS